MTTIIDTKDIVKQFAEAVKEKDIGLITSLLHADGAFDIQQPDLNIIESNKTTFINWFADKLSLAAIHSVAFDQCLLCKIGNPVILVNDGHFPRTVKDSSERAKTGLMMEVLEEKITLIKFCYTFVQTENKYQFECNGEKIKKYMEMGYTVEEAMKAVLKTEK